MPKTCAIVGCRTGHKRKKDEPGDINVRPVFDVKSKIESCYLSKDSAEVSTVIGGYVQKKLLDRTKCEMCKVLLQPTGAAAPDVPQKYLSFLSRGGLITPSSSMATYVGKSFAILDLVEDSIHRSAYPARALAEKIH